ncbi:MAG: tRNA (adenosine(37)-N6)-threonylcarbamoyltransferase complex ATPase subunit type 1 TsaE [Treponema sp.]|jgi:tRNA threonylcarbamoyladenosine biosynthesis protein TsaE|nr:tRNA (adenosine(37)-N6)-threonylcarbamoyltransferase complex ATPase subunit type 1 TsaE [Treponema sp.]
MAAGERIAPLLRPGSIVALRGGLGAGKTCLVKGIARGLGIDEEITSPTYTIVSEYRGRLPLYHIDAYRLNGAGDFLAMGGEEYLYGDGAALIEWSEHIAGSIPPGAAAIEIEITGETRRTLRIRGLEGLQ